MERIFCHLGQKPVSFYSGNHIRSLCRDAYVVEIKAVEQSYVFHRALRERLRRRAPEFSKDMLFKAAAVNSDAYRDPFFTAFVYNGLYPVRIADIAGVYTDLVRAGVCRAESQTVVEMDVGYDRHSQILLDLANRSRRLHSGHCKADDVASRPLEAQGLL